MTPNRVPVASPPRALLREPLLQFLLLGALLFAAERLVAAPAAMPVVVDAARVERLAALHRLQTGAAPDAAERERLVEGYVREELLYREARRLGLDEGDELVRRRLVQKMGFLNTDATTAAVPDEAALRAFHIERPAAFVLPSRASFEQLYFGPDRRGQQGAREAASAALAALRGGRPPASIVSDRLPVPVATSLRSRQDLIVDFGEQPVVDAVAGAPPGAWIGPVASGFGWHVLRVTERTEGGPSRFEDVETAVRDAWLRDARDRRERAALQALRSRWPVVRADLGEERSR
ncbi:MAG: peptidyl-prolyl cis-trans isomerase [Burkholderiales bacterium]|nr:MAG: peptidyl-prolyl cis-trans isomerase [Burkholderiales bacterium]